MAATRRGMVFQRTGEGISGYRIQFLGLFSPVERFELRAQVGRTSDSNRVFRTGYPVHRGDPSFSNRP